MADFWKAGFWTPGFWIPGFWKTNIQTPVVPVAPVTPVFVASPVVPVPYTLQKAKIMTASIPPYPSPYVVVSGNVAVVLSFVFTNYQTNKITVRIYRDSLKHTPLLSVDVPAMALAFTISHYLRLDAGQSLYSKCDDPSAKFDVVMNGYGL